MKRVAIIPARGGSKRIPGKNIRQFCGRPVIEYSIDVALESNLFEKVLVSTDSETVANVARSAGAEVPFLRSKEASGDFVPIATAVHEALLQIERYGQSYDTVCCLFAAAPFIKPEWLYASAHLLEQEDCQTVVPVKENPGALLRSLVLGREGMLKMVWPEQHQTRTQDLDRTFHDAGQFYWARASALKQRQAFYSDRARSFILDYLDCIDIDTEDDWKAAESLYQFQQTASTSVG